MSPLQVCHVVPHLDRVGGLERSALALAEHQVRAQRLHALLLTHAPSRPPAEAPQADSSDGPVIERLQRGLRRYHPGGWWRNHGGKLSVVHAHGLHKLCGQAVALAHRDGIPSLVKVATPSDVDLFADPEGWRRLPEADAEPSHSGLRRRWMVRTAFHRLRRAGAFVALNEEIAASLARHGLPFERIPNGVNCEHFLPAGAAQRAAARRQLGLPADVVCVAFAGRLVLRKDVACLLQALARLATREVGRSLVLVVAGDGPQGPALRALAAAGPAAQRIVFTGLQHDLRPLLAAADVFVHPALTEGQPNAVLEALACGLPVLLSDIAGHRDAPWLPGDAALLFPAGDSEALAAHLACLAAEPARRAAMSAAARSVALQRYDLRHVGERYLQLYRRLLAGRPREPVAGG